MLKLSLSNQIECAKSIYPLISNRAESDVVLTCHVFSKTTKKRVAFWSFLLLPPLVAMRVFYDNYMAGDFIESLLTETHRSTTRFLLIQFVLTAILTITSVRCYLAALSVDRELERVSRKYN
jgi:hypothetical protein